MVPELWGRLGRAEAEREKAGLGRAAAEAGLEDLRKALAEARRPFWPRWFDQSG